MPNRSWICVIDDDDAVRDSLAFLFDSADLSARTFPSAEAFLEVVENTAVGCVITDVRMPDMSGLDLLRELKSRALHMPVIVITGHGDVPLAVEAMKMGAFDFLEKPFAEEQLLDSVRRAMAQNADSGEDEDQSSARARLSRLSERERQVLQGIVAGQLNKTIAHELSISPRTVEVYRAKLMVKMEAGTFADLVRMAVRAGVIDA